jgi:glycosyltransferase involved in cell wall biosynthesis
MKLLHVITTMDPATGGTCQGIRNQANWFMKHGHVFEVVCLNDPDSAFLSGENFQIHALGQGRGQWRYHPKLLPWLNKNLPRFDAVIMNGLWQYSSYALFKAARHPNMPPYFIFPHGMLDPWFQRDPERRIKSLRNWCYWKVIEHRVVRHAEALLFTSAEEMRLARTTFHPYQPKREINVGLGIPQPPPYRAEMKKSLMEKCPGLKEKTYFLFLGRIHPKKGVDLLIKAYFALWRSSGDTRNSQFPKLVIAGPDWETPYGKQMQELASQICPPDSVFWPRMLAGDAKWGAIYNCEALVLFSHQENFGIAVVEALACEKPVLISNQVNIWREIEEDKAGLIGDDTLKGAEEIFWRWESLSPENRTAMKRAAKSSYENHFSIGIAAQHLLTTIEQSVGN